MNIEFVDLKRQLFGDPKIGTEGIYNEIMDKVKDCINNTAFIMGKSLADFESEFARYCGTNYCIGLNSGTDALEFALRCNNISSGNVITVPNSYFTTASSISQVGVKPIFVDVDKNTFNMDVNQLSDTINDKTNAILVVHLYGRPCNMKEIISIAEKHNLLVIEDCCHAPGARLNNVRVPIAKTGCFSFFPGKNIGCWGDGGALVTDDKNVADKAKMWRNDGTTQKYKHEIIGRKARLDTLQTAILSVKLKYLDKWNASRRQHAVLYNKYLESISEIQLPLLEDNNIEPVFHLYTIHTDYRDDLYNYLLDHNIKAGIHYPTSIHLQKAYKHLGLKKGSFPIAESLAQKTLSLPMFPELRSDEIEYISKIIIQFFNS